MYILRCATRFSRLGISLNMLRRNGSVPCYQPAHRRIAVLCKILKHPRRPKVHNVCGHHDVKYCSGVQITIGDVAKNVKEARVPQYVPLKYLSNELSQETLQHLRWMLQKDLLGQDMFLIGRPGPLRRQIAMQFLEMTNRELEYVSLSRDTTEADLKQRREIKNGTASYFDQSAVRAAVDGRILVIEGIEKAERNVLPVLNNLLENREMHLEDGRFLIPANRFDKLLQEHSKEQLDQWKLVRVSEDFRVIALGLPVPRYTGNPLDPPLRSRFQARDISGLTFKEQLEKMKSIAPNLDPAQISQLLSCCHALLSNESTTLGLPDFPADNVAVGIKLMDLFQGLPGHNVLYRLYPYKIFLNQEGQSAVEDVLKTFQMLQSRDDHPPVTLQTITAPVDIQEAFIQLECAGRSTEFQVACGSAGRQSAKTVYVPTPRQDLLLSELIQSHAYMDMCIIGPRGCGKSVTVERLASMLQYHIEPIVLYQDMSSRDLIQQRNTLPNGDTIWQNSPLVAAALEGKLAILDGIHRIHSSTLGVIHRLVHERELTLHDGKRLIRHDRYDTCKSKFKLTDDEMHKSGIFRIHPAFRMVALAEPPIIGVKQSQWLTSELLSLFLFHEMRPLTKKEEVHIINQLYGSASEAMKSIVQLAHRLRDSPDPTLKSLSGSLSTRQLLRIARRMATYPSENPLAMVHRACLSRFLPTLARQALNNALSEEGFSEINNQPSDELLTCSVDGETLKIGNTVTTRYKTDNKTKVPDILFYDVPQHIVVLEWLLQDFILGEHLLLVGNQGVGKNKLADRLLQLLNRPREYIQLHRDSTVQTLTLQPTVRGGIVIYEDSPLVKAVKLGHVLVVDEADKAPTHVTCILKTLVESGEMILSDGRRIVPASDARAVINANNIIPIHPDFRMIVLANRPGFPFLGNDFFGSLGDLFSCHAVDNPSPESEVSLLKQYGPNVPDSIILRLVKAFGELRTLADEGLLQYPYSTREVVNIVKHLQEFPSEGLSNVVRNVFDFDSYSSEARDILIETLHKNGIPIGTSPANINLAKELPLPPMNSVCVWKLPATSKAEKLLVEERFLKSKGPIRPLKREHPMDRVEARASVFSEMQCYWSLPIPQTSLIAGLTVSKGIENNPMKDWIHVLAVNPLSLYSMQPSGKIIQEISLQGLLAYMRGNRPHYTMASVGTSGCNILVHEKITNELVLVEALTGDVHTLPLVSSIEQTASSFARTLQFGSVPRNWNLQADLLEKDECAVLYEEGGHKVEIVDLESMMIYSITLPLKIKSIHIPSPEQWLIQGTDNKKFILFKSNESDPSPSNLLQINEHEDPMPCNISCCDMIGLGPQNLSQALDKKVEAPNRILCYDESYGGIAVGFPDLSTSEIYAWPRKEEMKQSQHNPIILSNWGQIIRTVPASVLPTEVKSQQHSMAENVSGYLEVTDVINKKLRYIPVPQPHSISPVTSWMYTSSSYPIFVANTSDNGLATVDIGGCVRLWETVFVNIEKSMEEWRKMLGSGKEYLKMTVDKPNKLETSEPKHGKIDETGAPHVGGNTWAGGTGGRDTAGLGGKGGPYRLDAGHDVYQVSQEEKDAVPEHVRKAAQEMAQKAFKQRLKEIQMSDYDAKLYAEFSDGVSQQVRALRVILSNLQAKSKERQWMKHQTSGELDDTKLIEGLTGEKTIYKRRADKEPEPGASQTKPKRLKLVVDVSGSMYRFNSYDGRLDREMEAAIMVMEAFDGHESQIQYDIVGHSGEEFDVHFVDHKSPPKDNKRRLDVIKTMHAHSQFCMSGDHTLHATQYAINSLSQEDCDEAIVVILSDANLERYGISPHKFSQILTSNTEVNAYAIFIGSLGDQAERLTKKLPAGRAFVCMDLKKIPQILQQIFSSSVLSGR